MDLLEQRAPRFKGRTVRIQAACEHMATALNLNPEQAYELSLASRFYDIGMLGVADGLLVHRDGSALHLKQVLNQHTALGGRLVATAFPDFTEGIEAIWYHHERPDGTGPYGLRGDEVPLLAGIIGLMEAVFDMVNPIPGTKPMTVDAIIPAVRQRQGRQFTIEAVQAFCAVAPEVCRILAGNDPAAKRGAHKVAPSSSTGVASGATHVTARGHQDSTENRTGSLPSLPQPQRRTLDDVAPLLGKQELAKLINEGLKLKPLGATVQNVMVVTANPRCSADDVARAVTQDQALSIRILKLANSSAYSRGRSVDSIKEAVNRIGVSEIRHVAAAMGVLEQYEGASSPGIDPRLFWEHSLGCALIGSALAKNVGATRMDNHFLWGVLHDVGRLILLDHLPGKYKIITDVARELNLPLEVVEKKLLLVDHCDILRQALEHWQFSRDFITPVVSHHRTAYQLKRLGPERMHDAAIMALANGLTHALLLGNSGNDMIYPLHELADLLGIKESGLAKMAESIPDELQSLKLSMLVRSAQANWPNALEQVREKLRTPLRPICVAAKDTINPFAFLCARLAGDGMDDRPNLGILYLRHARQQEKVMADFASAETRAGAESLSVVIICDRGEVNEEHAWLKHRRHALVQTPLRLSHLLNEINALLC